MARIPDEALERLKREASLARLIEAQGLKLICRAKTWPAAARGTTETIPRAASSARPRTCGTALAAMPAAA